MLNNNPEMVRLFLDRGADPIADSPFALALFCVLQPLLGLFKELLANDPRLQPQADSALVHYAEARNPRGVALMIWAGARPDASYPDEDGNDSESALEVAARAGDIPTLKQMKPEKYPALLPRS